MATEELNSGQNKPAKKEVVVSGGHHPTMMVVVNFFPAVQLSSDGQFDPKWSQLRMSKKGNAQIAHQ